MLLATTMAAASTSALLPAPTRLPSASATTAVATAFAFAMLPELTATTATAVLPFAPATTAVGLREPLPGATLATRLRGLLCRRGFADEPGSLRGG